MPKKGKHAIKMHAKITLFSDANISSLPNKSENSMRRHTPTRIYAFSEAKPVINIEKCVVINIENFGVIDCEIDEI